MTVRFITEPSYRFLVCRQIGISPQLADKSGLFPLGLPFQLHQFLQTCIGQRVICQVFGLLQQGRGLPPSDLLGGKQNDGQPMEQDSEAVGGIMYRIFSYNQLK